MVATPSIAGRFLRLARCRYDFSRNCWRKKLRQCLLQCGDALLKQVGPVFSLAATSVSAARARPRRSDGVPGTAKTCSGRPLIGAVRDNDVADADGF